MRRRHARDVTPDDVVGPNAGNILVAITTPFVPAAVPDHDRSGYAVEFIFYREPVFVHR